MTVNSSDSQASMHDTCAVVHFSTGLASAEVAFRAMDEYDQVVLLTADTTVEDEDNWRFADEVWVALGRPEWVKLCDGRSPMQVGRDERCVPNNRMAVCSRVLKRELLDRYCKERWQPDEIVHLLGYDWTERETRRHRASVEAFKPYRMDSPLMRPPWWQKGDLHAFRATRGIEPPRLYETGAPHANCGGACVRAGQVEWRRLLFHNKPRYLEWEQEEQKSRDELGKDVSILRHRSGPEDGRPLPLRTFREQLEAVPSLFDRDDTGSCGCDPWDAYDEGGSTWPDGGTSGPQPGDDNYEGGIQP